LAEEFKFQRVSGAEPDPVQIFRSPSLIPGFSRSGLFIVTD